MAANELERVKQDIATIKEAAGLELPFGWDSVWVNLIGLPFVGAWMMAYNVRDPYRPRRVGHYVTAGETFRCFAPLAGGRTLLAGDKNLRVLAPPR